MMDSLARDMWLISVGATLLAIIILLLLFWLLQKRQNLYVGILLAAIGFDKLTGFVGIPIFINGSAVPDGYAWVRTGGGVVILISIIIYGLHRFGLINGITSDASKSS